MTEAFGGALIDEPTIRFTLADMATALETSRIMLWRVACARRRRTRQGRTVRDGCVTSPTRATRWPDQALQLHGGYGYLKEYGLEKIVRDLRAPHPEAPTKSCAWSSAARKPPRAAPA